MDRETAERFSTARTMTEVGEIIADACEEGFRSDRLRTPCSSRE